VEDTAGCSLDELNEALDTACSTLVADKADYSELLRKRTQSILDTAETANLLVQNLLGTFTKDSEGMFVPAESNAAYDGILRDYSADLSLPQAPVMSTYSRAETAGQSEESKLSAQLEWTEKQIAKLGKEREASRDPHQATLTTLDAAIERMSEVIENGELWEEAEGGEMVRVVVRGKYFVVSALESTVSPLLKHYRADGRMCTAKNESR
jgi:hypothetical protein